MFTEPVNQDLIRAIRDQNDTYVEVNLVRRMTLGLTHLINEISASSAFSGKVSKSNSHSDSTGCFIIGTSNPILSKRYKLQELIGVGTFSQIYKATDSYFCCDVAIKVMRIGFHVLGMREVAFLRYFNSKQLRGAQQFVKLLGSFRFEKHFCIVLELYDTTLLSLLTMPEFNTAMHSESVSLPGFQNLLHQPKVVRPNTTKISYSNSPINNNCLKNDSREGPEKVAIDLKKLRKIAESLIFALCILHKEGAILYI
jgi:serine/threonine protein kinase